MITPQVYAGHIGYLSPFTYESIPASVIVQPVNLALGTWPSANWSIGIPFRLVAPFTVSKVHVDTGAVGNNIDVGVYAASGGRIFSTGSTAIVASQTPQTITLGSTVLLGPGDYFLAAAVDGTTSTVARTTTITAAILAALGAVGCAGNFPLGTSPSWIDPAYAFLPMVALRPAEMV